MSWKYYKKQFEVIGADENKFILGVDLGTQSSSIAYFNTVTEEPELIDLSGGYGKPSMPTVIQYIPETKEWVYGEYALLNKGLFDDYTITDIMGKIGKNEYVEIGAKTVSVVWLLSKYIKELIDFCKNVNPLSEIAGIVCVVPTYYSDEQKEELKSAFIGAGLEKQLICFITERDSVLIHNNFISGCDAKTIMTIDYGAGKLKAGIDRVMEDLKGIYVVTESYYEDESCGFNAIDKEINQLFTEIYMQEKNVTSLTEQELNHLFIFTHQNKAQMFKINPNNRPCKLYYNFAYPPFVKELSNDYKYDFTSRLNKKLNGFIKCVLEKSRTKISEKDIDKVILIGGGFESPIVKSFAEKNFSNAVISMSKHGKAALAEGAAIFAAKTLGVCGGEDFYIKDSSLLTHDYGIIIKSGEISRFVPVIEKNTFWWKERDGAVFTVNRSTEAPLVLKVYARAKNGEETELTGIELAGLEKRPKGATRLKVTLNFRHFAKLYISVEDFGFGEMFPKTDYKKEVLLEL